MSSTESKADCGSAANGAARRTSASSSSTSQVSIAVIATICWASTSSGLRGTRSDSMAPLRIRSVTTADWTRSPRYLGKTTPVETAPTWCPARPTRWSPEATEGGDSTWTTRSTAPMSMPSSRLEVATTAGSSPDFSCSSTSARCSLETEPWCARASTGGAARPTPACAISSAGAPVRGRASPVARSWAISFSRPQSRSASRRELAKTMVERWASIRSVIRSSTCGQIDAERSGCSASGRPSVARRHPCRRRFAPHLPTIRPDPRPGPPPRGRSASPRAAGRSPSGAAAQAAVAQPAGHALDRAHRRGQADPLGRGGQ